MSETVDLARLDAQGLQQVYDTRIAPILAGFEAPRLLAMERYRRRLRIGLPIAAGVALLTFLMFREAPPTLFAGLAASAMAYFIARLPLDALGREVKASMLKEIAGAIGVTYSAGFDGDALVARFRALDLVSSYDRAKYEDWFHGERQGMRFDLFEAHLEDERKDSDGDTTHVTVFRGQMIRMTFPKAFAGVTVVRRDSGMFNALVELGAKLGERKLSRVGLADPKFEKIFEVYGTDQVEARVLVHPVFIERLVEVEKAFEGKRVRCAFEGGDLLVAVEGGDRFEAGDMTRTLTEEGRAREVLDDVAKILRLMDSVLTAETAPLLR